MIVGKYRVKFLTWQEITPEQFTAKEADFKVESNSSGKWDFGSVDWPIFRDFRFDSCSEAMAAAQESHERYVMSLIEEVV